MAFLELQSVQKRFGGGTIAVSGVDLEVEKGEFVSFLGPSGCGKTTTLRMIAGFERPTSGRVRVDGVDVTDKPPNRRNVGMVFQSYALFPNMTVAANIGYGLRIRHVDGRRIADRVAELLALIHLEDRGGRYPWQLSGGQQQRVALARALAIEPQLLLLDEPLSALDAKIRLALRQEIRSIQRQLGITTVYVTHDQEEALSLSDRIVVMNDGHVEQVGAPAEVYGRPASTFVARFIGHLNIFEAHVVDPAAGRVRVGDQEIRASIGLSGYAREARVQIAVRPESLRFGEPPAGFNVLRGTVSEVTFLGATVRLRLRIDDRHEVSVDTFNDAESPLPDIGSTVSISFPTGAVLGLDLEPAAQSGSRAASSAPHGGAILSASVGG